MKWLSSIGFVAIYCLAGAVHGADPVQRIDDPVLLARGQALFQQHCAACHGDKAQGTVDNWQQRDASGKLPPPPLNGTAHAWHHSINGLARTIREGTISLGGSMPPWGDTHSDEEVFAVIVWFSSLWPDDLYDTWMQMNRAEAER